MNSFENVFVTLNKGEFLIFTPIGIKINIIDYNLYSVEHVYTKIKCDISMISFLKNFILPRVKWGFDCFHKKRYVKDCLIKIDTEDKEDLLEQLSLEYIKNDFEFFNNGISLCINFLTQMLTKMSKIDKELQIKIDTYWNLYNMEESDYVLVQKSKIGNSIIDDFVRILNKKEKTEEKKLLKSFSKDPFVDPFRESLQLALKKGTEQVSVKELEEMWNNPFYGPIVGSMIYSTHILQNIPIKALQNTWSKLRKEIEDIAKMFIGKELDRPLFVAIFDILQKFGKNVCYYSSNKYNFINDFYTYGGCNCACGTYLSFVISEMYPDPKYKVAAISTPEHILLLIKENKKGGELYELETTKIENYYRRIKKEKYMYKANALIRSSQMLAINHLLSDTLSVFTPEIMYKLIVIISSFFGTYITDMVCNSKGCKKSLHKLYSLKDKKLFQYSSDIHYFFHDFFVFQYKTQEYLRKCKYVSKMGLGIYKRSRVEFRKDYEAFLENVKERDPERELRKEIDFYVKILCANNLGVLAKYSGEDTRDKYESENEGENESI